MGLYAASQRLWDVPPETLSHGEVGTGEQTLGFLQNWGFGGLNKITEGQGGGGYREREESLREEL